MATGAVHHSGYLLGKKNKNSSTLPSGRGGNCSPDWGEAFISLTPGESGRRSKRSKVDENSVTHGKIPPPPGLIQHPQLKSIRPAGLSRGVHPLWLGAIAGSRPLRHALPSHNIHGGSFTPALFIGRHPSCLKRACIRDGIAGWRKLA